MENNLKEIVAKAIENGTTEVIFREGKAKELLPEKEIKKVIPLEISGKGGTCKRFLDYRKKLHNADECSALVDLQRGKILLKVNECQKDDKNIDTIVSQYEISKEITDLRLNSGFGRTPKDLFKLLRFYKRFAANKESFQDFLSKLTKFSAHISANINAIDDRRGSSNKGISKDVSHDLPENFILTIPIIGKPISISISLEFDSDSELFQLWSDDFSEKFSSELESEMSLEISAIEDFCLVVYV